MARKEDEGGEGSRERILSAATRLFAEKGFDGSRVDQIAEQASVNKALIYYYFKSKEKLLEAILERLADDAVAKLSAIADAFVTVVQPADALPFFEYVLDFLEEREDELRVVLMESLKRRGERGEFFPLVADLLDRMIALAGRNGPVEDPEREKVMEFFTGLLPIVSYVVYRRSWMEVFGLDEKELRTAFIRSFMDSHFTATERLYAPPPVSGSRDGG